MSKRWVVILVMFFSLLNLIGCSNNSTQAIKNGDIVNLHGKFINIERLVQFLENVKAKKKDEIRVTSYTIEGDPIFHDIKHDGKNLILKYDNSKDKYGSSNIFSVVCDNIVQVETESGIEYSVNGCTGERSEVSFLLLPINR